jgi:hypothetical protein
VIPSMLAGLALAQAPEEQSSQELRRYALLVGHNDGGEGRTPLRYAHQDAEQMAAVLTELGGVAPEHHQLLLDPDRAGLDQALDAIRTSLQSEQGAAEFVFYYSGHSDEEGLLLGEELYGYRELRQSLDGLPARVRIAILDSCASGALILAKGGRRVAPFLVDESSHVGGFAYLTSSSADEVSQEAERIGGSYFTHFLASGLRGAADTSGDGRVTLSEAYSFAHEETLQRTERTQHGPQHAAHEFQLSGTGEYVLTDLGLTSASLVLDETVIGRASIRDNDGNLVVEVQKVGGRAIELGLEEGRYTVTVTMDDEQYGEAVVEVALGASTLVAEGAFAWYDTEATALRGDGPPSAIVAPVVVPLEDRAYRISFTRDLPEVPPGIDHFSLAVFSAHSEELNGLALASTSYTVEGKASGLVLAMGGTVVGELDGFQTAMGANVARRGGGGVQTAIGANIAGPFKGAQLSAGVNVASGGIRGFQGTMGGNVASGESRGMQAAPLFNQAHNLDGVQLSLVNVGRDVHGTQIGLVNIARNVSGAQIGLVNVAHDVDGAPLGLFSFEKEGRHDLLLFASESNIANAELKLGGDYIYTVLGVGYGTHPVDRPEGMSARDWDVEQPHLYNSMGFGLHLPFKKPWLDLDALMSAYIPLGTTVVGGDRIRGAFENPPTVVAQTRATFGYQIAKQFAPFVGASMNVRLPLEYELIDIAPYDGSGEMLAWPGIFGGLQF